MPRARARRSVRSWSGVALPRSAATGEGSSATSADDEPAGRRQGGVQIGIDPARHDRGRAQADDPRRGERLAGPGQPLGPPLAIGQDQDEARRRVRRRQVAVEERLEVAVGGRQPRRLLDLEHELSPRGPIRTRGDDEQVRGVGQRPGDPLGAGLVVRPVARRGRSHGRRRRAGDRTDARPTAAAATIGLR